MNPQARFILVFILVFLFAIVGCKKDPKDIPLNNFVHFPIGLRSIDIETLRVEADSLIRNYTIYHDDFGGRWLRIPFNKLNKKSRVKISFLKKDGPLMSVQENKPIPALWTEPSAYIDSKHSGIVQKASHLTDGFDGINIKAKNIQLFVSDYIEYKIFKDCGLVSASATLESGYGTCINSSRVFVALCRAAGIPARSVSGSIYNGYSFISHHNWAEFVDEDGNWHPCDFSFTSTFDLNDIRYLDLLYAPEQNKYYQDYEFFRISPNGDYFYYDASPNAVDGKLQVEILSDNYPDEFELSMTYAISRLFDD